MTPDHLLSRADRPGRAGQLGRVALVLVGVGALVGCLVLLGRVAAAPPVGWGEVTVAAQAPQPVLALGVDLASLADPVDPVDPAESAGSAAPGAGGAPAAGVELVAGAYAGAVDAPALAATLRLDDAWVTQVAAATGISQRALTAYARASLLLAAEDPSCRVGWTTLAGIGAIESGHGTFGGTSLRADGRTETLILGPALDGRPGFAAIPATPQTTALHGDPLWDRAMGPMQFIPSTWARWASDGDGDGVTDPHDIDDAAYAAARYLCASGGDLSTTQGWRPAILSYNRSQQYALDVLARANQYATAASGA